MDAVEWLQRPGSIPSNAVVITSLPDVSEVHEFAPTVAAWEAWFVRAAKAVLEALPSEGAAIFYQTDIRETGVGQVSKASMVLRAVADVEDVSLIWHKIAHFGNVDKSGGGSPKFSHLLCVGRGSRLKESFDTSGLIPDVVWRGLKPTGLKNCARCMGANSVRVSLRWASKALSSIDTVVDPFCGAGTALAVANALGFHAIGVDISPRRTKQAKALDGQALLAAEEEHLATAAGAGDSAGAGIAETKEAKAKTRHGRGHAPREGKEKAPLKDPPLTTAKS